MKRLLHGCCLAMSRRESVLRDVEEQKTMRQGVLIGRAVKLGSECYKVLIFPQSATRHILAPSTEYCT